MTWCIHYIMRGFSKHWDQNKVVGVSLTLKDEKKKKIGSLVSWDKIYLVLLVPWDKVCELIRAWFCSFGYECGLLWKTNKRFECGLLWKTNKRFECGLLWKTNIWLELGFALEKPKIVIFAGSKRMTFLFDWWLMSSKRWTFSSLKKKKQKLKEASQECASRLQQSEEFPIATFVLLPLRLREGVRDNIGKYMCDIFSVLILLGE